jgi:hypothetical protein
MATISGEIALITSGDEVHRKADRCAGAPNRPDAGRPNAGRPLEALRVAHHRDDPHRGVHRLDENRLDEHHPDDRRQGARHRIDPLTVVRRSAEGLSDASVSALNSADAGRLASPRAGGRLPVWAGMDGHPADGCPRCG